MSFFEGLEAEQYDRDYSDRQLARRLTAYFGEHGRRLILVALLVLLVAGMGAVEPVIVGRGIDFVSRDRAVILWLLPLAVLLVGLGWWLGNWGRRSVTVRIIGDVIRSLQSDAYSAAIHQDLAFYDQFDSGRIVSRMTSDTQDFTQLVDMVTGLLPRLLQMVVLGGILLSLHWPLALVMFAILPVIFAFAYAYRVLARRFTRRGMRAIASVNAAIKESVTGIAVAKNFRQERAVFDEFEEANSRSYRTNLTRGVILNVLFPVMTAFAGAATGLIVYLGGMSVLRGTVTVGIWFLFLQSLQRFMYPVMQLSGFWTQVQNGLAAAERIFALIDADRVVVQQGNSPVNAIHGEIRFDDLCFSYREGEPVLDHFDLTIRPGERLALVGHTGAGKSSIIRLISRFYEFQAGQLLIDGQDIRKVDLQQLRQRIGLVTQTPVLFSGSVADNILFGASDASREDIMAMARHIDNGEWLRTLPNGLDTPVGERGALLSMGERQLVALMRVLMQRPDLFLLDEATASVDPFTEVQIQDMLGMVLETTTSIIVAHRLNTVKAVDRILVLDHGTITEEGNHDGLLAQNGHYAELYNTYFRHQSLDYAESARDLAESVQ